MKLSEKELKDLAAQLRKPEGEHGLKVGEMMQFTNDGLIKKAMESLNLKDGESVLEIGPGNGAHLKSALHSLPSLRYFGIDISETMIDEASKLNQGKPNISFTLTDGKTIPFSNDAFDKIMTANTIYFWEDPEQYIAEIARVMKPGARLSIAFIPKSTMQYIPFAKYGFTMYGIESVKKLIEDAGLQNYTANTYSETVASNSGEEIVREFVIASVQK